MDTIEQRREKWKLHMREYRKKNPNRKWNSEGYYKNITSRYRKTALEKIANGKELKCDNCGCNDKRLIEINHKNGGGTKEFKMVHKGHIREFYRAINNGTREVDDLNLLCKICNTLHHVQENLGIHGHEVIWNMGG